MVPDGPEKVGVSGLPNGEAHPSPAAPGHDPAQPNANESSRERALEALLFLADEPASAASLARVLGASRSETEAALHSLARAYEDRRSGLVLRRVAGGWRLFTHPDVAAQVEEFVLSARHARLTAAGLETLAIVAYKQPVTRHQISSIRGVNAEGTLRALIDRGLVREVGRDDGPGRATLFGTTPEFLERLGLDSLADLPPIGPLLVSADEPADGPARNR
jgi:segregation and condensation protein B